MEIRRALEQRFKSPQGTIPKFIYKSLNLGPLEFRAVTHRTTEQDNDDQASEALRELFVQKLQKLLDNRFKLTLLALYT